MAVNSPGINAPKTPPPPPPVNRGNQGSQGANTQGPAANAAAKANAPSATSAPPPASFVPATNAGPGGTTTQGPNTASARGQAQGAPPPVSAQANAVAALMGNVQGLAFLAGGKVSGETKSKRGTGDAKEDSGDVKVESESEARGAQALQDTSGELGQGGEMGAATGAGATST
ncbi:MAG: hypothetical protein HYR97_03250 [Candidatus Melainabacteria bacterium]|nr:hypothetical protein [Candidatus Melainabacteria bacterium]MBI3309367.1 hypothetical protein [Candidatus Melainabacteria bacterium]